MPADRVEANLVESRPTTQLNQALFEGYENYSHLFKSGFHGAAGGTDLDCASHDIYKQSASDSSGKMQESNEGARPTPLAQQQRMERLAQNKDLDQSSPSEKVSNTSGDSRKSEDPDKSQESHEGAKPTPLAEQQRMQRLAQNQDVQQLSPAEKHLY